MSEEIFGSELKDLASLSSDELMNLFPQAKLTMKDRIPTNVLLLYTILNINKSIRDIKFSEDEIREAILSLVAMIPDELRDPEFKEELQKSQRIVEVDIRPEFCGVKASYETCNQRGIPTTRRFKQVDYFAMYHAVFNLLMRQQMLLRTQHKEIMTMINVPKIEEAKQKDIQRRIDEGDKDFINQTTNQES